MKITLFHKLMHQDSNNTFTYKIKFQKQYHQEDGNMFVYRNSAILASISAKCNIFSVYIRKWHFKKDYDELGHLYYPPKISFFTVSCASEVFDLFIKAILQDKTLAKYIEIVEYKKCRW